MTGDQALRAARAACGRHDWAAARQGFRAAGELGTQDLGSLATACWWLGEVEEYAVATAELHRQFMGLGRPVEAALAAFELDTPRSCGAVRTSASGGWPGRRRLLQEQPEAPEWGFVLVADAQQALVEGDLDTAGGLAREALAIGERHGLSTVVALARFLCGCAAVHQGRTAQGLRDVDEAMLPVQAGEVDPEWVGSLYCDTMSLCFELWTFPGPALDHADRTLARGSHPGGDVHRDLPGPSGPAAGRARGMGSC